MFQALLSKFGIEIYTGRTSVAAPYPRLSQHGVLQVMKERGRLNFETVIDIGAGDGTKSILDLFPSTNLVLIEPLDFFEQPLREIVKSRKSNTVYLKNLLASSKSIVDFFEHEDHFGSSINMEFELSKNQVKTKLEAVPLDYLLSNIDFSGPYFIKIDTQGSELEILKGAPKTLRRTEALIIEVSVQDFFIDSHTLKDVFDFLYGYDFRVFDFADLTYRPSDGFLAQLDILFVKKSSNLFKIKNYG